MSSLPVSGLVTLSGKVARREVFLRHMREDGLFDHTLKFCAPDGLKPYTRFVVEPSANNEGLFHIRSCYTNKYWVPTQINGCWYISVTAKEPVEEQGSDSCTLFELFGVSRYNLKEYSSSGTSIKTCSSIVKEQISSAFGEERKECCLWVTSNGLLVWTSNDRNDQYMGLFALNEEKVLPKYVRFKGDNGKYLGCLDNGKYLKFECTDPCDAGVIHSIHYHNSGLEFRVKSEKANRFWYRHRDNHDWIDASANTESAGTSFRWVTLGDNMIALRLGRAETDSVKFLKRESSSDGFNACADSVESCARFQLEEAILTREITNVQYHLDAARVYDNKDLVMATARSDNRTSTEAIAKLNLKYSTATTSSWSKSTTKSWGVSTSVHLGVPKLLELTGVDFKIEIGAHYDQAQMHEDGGSISHSEEQSVEYEMKVPPGKEVTVKAFAKRASYDIPYSYQQTDVLISGDIVTTKIEDGMFRGASGYEFTHKATERKLAEKELAEQQGTEGSQN